MSTAGRGVLYVVWGDYNKVALNRSLASLKTYHPELPVHIETLPAGSTLLDKAAMLEITPFAETVFLDVDTVVMGNLDFGFTKARQFDTALCICECPWARRYGGLDGDMIEYNTGVIFFTTLAKPLFDCWRKRAPEIDSSIDFVVDGQAGRMPLNDQAGFAAAVEETGKQPFILPHNWNFRPKWQKSWYGPLKIWHDYGDPPAALITHNLQQSDPANMLLASNLA
ncbi:MAG: hypothetical protein HQ483_06690 [Rhodospirillales bacterium]|nr:hypothetical protein [Rhodospirillales bacterium]